MLNVMKSGGAEIKNLMYGSVIGWAKNFFKCASLADTCFFEFFIPVS